MADAPASLDKVRAACKKRGASGVKGLGRLFNFAIFFLHVLWGKAGLEKQNSAWLLDKELSNCACPGQHGNPLVLKNWTSLKF